MTTTAQLGPIREWYCQTKAAWGEAWISRPQIDVVSLDWPLSDISTATFRHHYGEIDDGSGTYANVQPVGELLAGHWVRIMRPAGEGESEPQPVWHGRIASAADSRGDYGNAGLIGTDLLVAHGMELLLERAAVTTSTTTTADVKTPLPFNIRSKLGSCRKGSNAAWVGNMSADTYGGHRVFEDSINALDWDGCQIVKYLLKWNAPQFITWTLSGTYGNLAAWKGSMGSPPNVLAGIRAIADRRRGHAWRVYMSDDEQTAQVEIYSCFGETVEAGGVTLSAEQTSADLDLDAAGIASTNPIIRRDESHEFDKIVVTGAPLVIMGTLRASADELIAGWPAALETAYENAPASQRGYEKYAAVYKVLKADTDKMPAGPGITEEGYIDTSQTPEQFWLGRSLLSRLPVQADLDDGSDGAESPADFRAPLVLLKATVGEDVIYAPADKPIEPGGLAAGMHVSMIDGEPGIRLSGKHNHYLGMNHFVAAAGAMDPRSPICDYKDIIATVAWTSSVPLQVTATISEATEAPRVLNISIPHAECWYQLANTALEPSDVNSDGTIQSSGAEILRNDREQLAAVAAMAKAWYSRTRRAITVTYDVLTTWLTPGVFVDHVNSVSGGSLEVNTLVSRIVWNCDEARTTVQTDFAQLDFAAASGADRPAGGTIGAGAMLSAPDVRDRLAPPITRPADAAIHNPRPVCKIITNEDDGEYTITAMKWDATTEDWIVDSSDTALTAAAAHDWQADIGGQVDDLVHYWTLHDDDGELVVMLDVGTAATVPSASETGGKNYAYKAHLIGFNSADEDPFWTVEDVLDSKLHIYMELRDCDGDGATGSHPGFKGPIYHSYGTNPYGVVVTVDDTGDDAWHAVSVPWIYADGTQHTWDTLADPVYKIRITAAGNLEFMVDMNPDGSYYHQILYITVEQISRPVGILTLPELGTQDIQGVEPHGHDHEYGTDTPNIWPWGDGKWRHV